MVFERSSNHPNSLVFKSSDNSLTLYVGHNVVPVESKGYTLHSHSLVLAGDDYKTILKQSPVIKTEYNQSQRYHQSDKALIEEGKKELEEILLHIIKLAPTANQLLEVIQLVQILKSS